jgi:hypothetical protein
MWLLVLFSPQHHQIVMQHINLHTPQVHIQVLFPVAVQLVEVESIGPDGLRKGWMGGLQNVFWVVVGGGKAKSPE